MAKCTWEFQRQWHPGLWTHQSVAGTPTDPRGYEESDLAPMPFAQAVADRHELPGEWRLAVWDTLRLGVQPVATVERTQPGRSVDAQSTLAERLEKTRTRAGNAMWSWSDDQAASPDAVPEHPEPTNRAARRGDRDRAGRPGSKVRRTGKNTR